MKGRIHWEVQQAVLSEISKMDGYGNPPLEAALNLIRHFANGMNLMWEVGGAADEYRLLLDQLQKAVHDVVDKWEDEQLYEWEGERETLMRMKQLATVIDGDEPYYPGWIALVIEYGQECDHAFG